MNAFLKKLGSRLELSRQGACLAYTESRFDCQHCVSPVVVTNPAPETWRQKNQKVKASRAAWDMAVTLTVLVMMTVAE